jgi:hypothetical protein
MHFAQTTHAKYRSLYKQEQIVTLFWQSVRQQVAACERNAATRNADSPLHSNSTGSQYGDTASWTLMTSYRTSCFVLRRSQVHISAQKWVIFTDVLAVCPVPPAGTVPHMRLQSLPFKSFPIHYSSVILSFDAT